MRHVSLPTQYEHPTCVQSTWLVQVYALHGSSHPNVGPTKTVRLPSEMAMEQTINFETFMSTPLGWGAGGLNRARYGIRLSWLTRKLAGVGMSSCPTYPEHAREHQPACGPGAGMMVASKPTDASWQVVVLPGHTSTSFVPLRRPDARAEMFGVLRAHHTQSGEYT